MATVSGGIFDPSVANNGLSQQQGFVISQVLQSTGLNENSLSTIEAGGSQQVSLPGGGSVTVQAPTGSSVFVGAIQSSASEKPVVAAIMKPTASGVAVSGVFSDGLAQITLALPPGQLMSSEGPAEAVTVNEAITYLNNKVAELAASSGGTDSAESLQAQITTLMNIAQGSDNVVIRIVSLADASSTLQQNPELGGLLFTLEHGENEILFDASSSDSVETLLFQMSQVGSDKTLVIKGVESAAIVGPGSVRVADDNGVRIVAGAADHVLVGGGGADTLVGGGGSDSLTGGAGGDTFGFNSLGRYTVTDFSRSEGDGGAFTLDGITDIAALNATITSVVQTAEGVTYHFGESASITVLGVSAADITADLIQFTI